MKVRKLLPALCALAMLAALAACGGGGGASSGGNSGGGGGEPPPRAQLIGEVLNQPEQVTASELATTAGFGFDSNATLATSEAIRNAGKANLLDVSFVLAPPSPTVARQTQTASDADSRLAQYARDHADLVVPGVRVLVADEVFLNTINTPLEAGTALMQLQLDGLRQAVALVRRVLPQARVGITVSPYAVFRRADTLDFVRQAVTLVDWVGTDPYWLDDGTPVQQLHDWTRSFPALVRAANPGVETWLIAQGFKLPVWHADGFNSYITQHLGYAPLYDNVLFFGWQFTAELDPASAGMYFPSETKRLYQKYLKNPVP